MPIYYIKYSTLCDLDDLKYEGVESRQQPEGLFSGGIIENHREEIHDLRPSIEFISNVIFNSILRANHLRCHALLSDTLFLFIKENEASLKVSNTMHVTSRSPQPDSARVFKQEQYDIPLQPRLDATKSLQETINFHNAGSLNLSFK